MHLLAPAFLLAALNASASAAESLPLTARGGRLEVGTPHASIVRKFRLPTPGVWYIWLKAAKRGVFPAEVRFSVNGGTVPEPRSVIRVSSRKPRWVSRTMRDRFLPQVHADKAGDYTVELTAVRGKVDIEAVALTLFYTATPTADGRSLDHTRDPGGGRAYFPVPADIQDGFREDRASPPIRADRTFYADAERGQDKAAGTSPETAWRTTERVNREPLLPGDAVLFRRGGKWRGGLSPKGNGTAERRITIGAWGDGPRPLVTGEGRDALHLEEQSHWVIQDLELTTDLEGELSGLRVITKAAWKKRLKEPRPRDITIVNVVSHDNGVYGIHVGSDYDNGDGYDGVLIENCYSYCNGADGIMVAGTTARGARNTVIRYCTAHTNQKMAGIWIHSGQNGLIEHCRSYNNWCYNIWTWNSVNVTIRNCEAFRGVGANVAGDEGGFDIDWTCEAATIEYCHSHHNNGMGFLLMGLGEGDYYGLPRQSRYNVVRYCVSVDDNPGIWSVETFEFGKIYNNLIATSRHDTMAVGVQGWPRNKPDSNPDGGWPADCEYVNNIFVATNGSIPLLVTDHAARQRNVFDHNLYFRGEPSGPLVKWGGRKNRLVSWEPLDGSGEPPAEYRTLEEFRAGAGQEMHGNMAEPRLDELFRGEYGSRPLAGLRFLADSPANRAGRPDVLTKEWLAERAKYLRDTGAGKFGIPMAPEPVTKDFWGNPVGSTRGISIGPGEPGGAGPAGKYK